MPVYSLFLWNTLFRLNNYINNFQHVFFPQFKKLIDEPNHPDFVNRIADYIRLVNSMDMFVRVERPVGSKNFVLARVKCDRVFSFAFRFEKMRLLLCRIPPTVLRETELPENKQLRLANVGQTDYEQALTTYRYDNGPPPLNAAIFAKDEESAEALLDGGDDPNEVDEYGRNALHMAAWEGCRLPLFHRILGMIHNVNAVTNYWSTALMIAARWNRLDIVTALMNHPGIDVNVMNVRNSLTALMKAARWNHLDIVTALMNHPGIDVNVQSSDNWTALHWAVEKNRPAIVAQLVSDDRVDCSIKHEYLGTPLNTAIVRGYHECEIILRKHGAPEE